MGKNFKIFVILFAICLIQFSKCADHTIHLDPAGDESDGSNKAKAYKTLDKALDELIKKSSSAADNFILVMYKGDYTLGTDRTIPGTLKINSAGGDCDVSTSKCTISVSANKKITLVAGKQDEVHKVIIKQTNAANVNVFTRAGVSGDNSKLTLKDSNLELLNPLISGANNNIDLDGVSFTLSGAGQLTDSTNVGYKLSATNKITIQGKSTAPFLEKVWEATFADLHVLKTGSTPASLQLLQGDVSATQTADVAKVKAITFTKLTTDGVDFPTGKPFIHLKGKAGLTNHQLVISEGTIAGLQATATDDAFIKLDTVTKFSTLTKVTVTGSKGPFLESMGSFVKMDQVKITGMARKSIQNGIIYFKNAVPFLDQCVFDGCGEATSIGGVFAVKLDDPNTDVTLPTGFPTDPTTAGANSEIKNAKGAYGQAGVVQNSKATAKVKSFLTENAKITKTGSPAPTFELQTNTFGPDTALGVIKKKAGENIFGANVFKYKCCGGKALPSPANPIKAWVLNFNAKTATAEKDKAISPKSGGTSIAGGEFTALKADNFLKQYTDTDLTTAEAANGCLNGKTIGQVVVPTTVATSQPGGTLSLTGLQIKNYYGPAFVAVEVANPKDDSYSGTGIVHTTAATYFVQPVQLTDDQCKITQPTCTAKQYLDSNTVPGTCKSCNSKCTTCSDGTTCDTCTAPAALDNAKMCTTCTGGQIMNAGGTCAAKSVANAKAVDFAKQASASDVQKNLGFILRTFISGSGPVNLEKGKCKAGSISTDCNGKGTCEGTPKMCKCEDTNKGPYCQYTKADFDDLQKKLKEGAAKLKTFTPANKQDALDLVSGVKDLVSAPELLDETAANDVFAALEKANTKVGDFSTSDVEQASQQAGQILQSLSSGANIGGDAAKNEALKKKAVKFMLDSSKNILGKIQGTIKATKLQFNLGPTTKATFQGIESSNANKVKFGTPSSDNFELECPPVKDLLGGTAEDVVVQVTKFDDDVNAVDSKKTTQAPTLEILVSKTDGTAKVIKDLPDGKEVMLTISSKTITAKSIGVYYDSTAKEWKSDGLTTTPTAGDKVVIKAKHFTQFSAIEGSGSSASCKEGDANWSTCCKSLSPVPSNCFGANISFYATFMILLGLIALFI